MKGHELANVTDIGHIVELPAVRTSSMTARHHEVQDQIRVPPRARTTYEAVGQLEERWLWGRPRTSERRTRSGVRVSTAAGVSTPLCYGEAPAPGGVSLPVSRRLTQHDAVAIGLSTGPPGVSLRTEGIRTRDGRVLDHGTGMSRKAVISGTRGLVEKGIISVRKKTSPANGSETNIYRLRFKGEEYAPEVIGE